MCIVTFCSLPRPRLLHIFEPVCSHCHSLKAMEWRSHHPPSTPTAAGRGRSTQRRPRQSRSLERFINLKTNENPGADMMSHAVGGARERLRSSLSQRFSGMKAERRGPATKCYLLPTEIITTS
ncbi:UNVERIFIED_CONTAM: hypothetical protein FKN15_066295 [Acipenser sinensis]